MRISIVLAAGLLAFSHVSSADELIQLSQPLHLELPKASAPASPAASAPGADVAKPDTPKPAGTDTSVAVKQVPKEVILEADDKTQEALAQKIKVRLDALRKRQAEREAAAKAAANEKPKKPVIINHWSYAGEDGPEHWGHINPAWTQCAAGQRQSPINIHDGIKVDLEKIKFDYKPVHYKVTDNGHTIQVDLEPGNTFTLTGHTYNLLQFHFHRPSEEHIDGKGFPMVVHLVHMGDDGKLAVVALLVNEGAANSIIQNVWNNLPLERRDPVIPVDTIDVSQLLPAAREYYTYMGSLTTPPCSEEVTWMVMKQPIQMSPSQIAIFARLYPMNARPVQPGHERIIKESN
jgi:carbonic anhydrase